MANLNFNAQQVDPAQSFDPIPAGWYNVKINESEMKPTKNGQGAYLELEMEVIDGQHAGRKIWDRLNLQNQNQTAVEIAYRTLSAICHATGVIQCQDSQQLHNIPMEAKVIVRAATDQYEATNEVRGYRAAGSGNGNGMGNPAGGNNGGGMQNPNQGGMINPAQNQNQNPAMNQQQQYNPNQQQQGGWDANQNQNMNQQNNQQQSVQQNNGGWDANQQNMQQQNMQQNQNQNQGGFDPNIQQQQQQQNQNQGGNGQADGGAPSAGQDGELPPWMQN